MPTLIKSDIILTRWVMTLNKNKQCIKYFVLAVVLLACLYSSKIADLFIPIFDNIYYGNLVSMFVAIASAIIWAIEIAIILFVCKKFGVEIFTKKQDKKELPLIRVILLFVITILPMIVISACIGWKVKIVYALGVKVTTVGLVCNVCEILAYAVRLILMLMFIVCVQKGFETLINSKVTIPYGALFALITFGLIDFFVLAMDLRVFYLVVSFLYGVIYLLADRKFSTTWILCYLIYLL